MDFEETEKVGKETEEEAEGETEEETKNLPPSGAYQKLPMVPKAAQEARDLTKKQIEGQGPAGQDESQSFKFPKAESDEDSDQQSAA